MVINLVWVNKLADHLPGVWEPPFWRIVRMAEASDGQGCKVQDQTWMVGGSLVV